MPDPQILFDVLDRSTGLGATIFKFLFGIGFPSLLLFFAVRAFRKARTKSQGTVMAVLGVVAGLFFVTGIGTFVTDPGASRYRQRMENHDFTELQGKITHLTESSLLAGNPAATFEVGGNIFTYGRGSENYELEMAEKGGILANGLPVKIWFKDQRILRVFSVEEESK